MPSDHDRRDHDRRDHDRRDHDRRDHDRRDHDRQRDFAEYFAARHDAVRRSAYLLCGDWHWADDLTQVAFVRLAAGWPKIREPAAVDGYLRTCLVRAFLAETRRLWRRRERSVADPPHNNATTVGDDSETITRRMAFAAALGTLPPRQRAVLVCRYYQGLDVAETAATLGCSEGTVKSQTARGLAKLRQRMRGADDVGTEGIDRGTDRNGFGPGAPVRPALARERGRF